MKNVWHYWFSGANEDIYFKSVYVEHFGNFAVVGIMKVDWIETQQFSNNTNPPNTDKLVNIFDIVI